MVPSIKVNGSSKKTKKIEEEFKFGPMAADTTDSGEMAWPMDMADSFMPKEMSMRESGLMIRPMVSGFTLISTVAGMKASGTKISNTDTELNNGQMVPNMRETTSKA